MSLKRWIDDYVYKCRKLVYIDFKIVFFMSVSFCLSVSFSFILLRKPYLSPLITAVQRNRKIFFYYSLKSLPLACNGHGTRMQVSRMYTSNNRWRHWDQFFPFILPFYAFKTCCGRYSTNSETFLAYLFIAVFFCSYRFAFISQTKSEFA